MRSMNPLRRKFVGAGRLSDDLRAALTAEGLLFLEEGLAGSITYRSYRAPGRRSNLRKEATSGTIAVTTQRLVIWAGGGKNIDIPLNHPFRAALKVNIEQPGGICFSYDAGRFRRDRSGTVEVRLRTAQAARVADLLRASSSN
jgi:hypothetical protein